VSPTLVQVLGSLESGFGLCIADTIDSAAHLEDTPRSLYLSIHLEETVNTWVH